jgi:hypothetical protein
VTNVVHMYILSRPKLNARLIIFLKHLMFDGSRLISVVLIACFEPRNRDSESAFSCDLNSIHWRALRVSIHPSGAF